jgi:ribosomal protein S18 acetylase RimI-like enzyme
MRTLGLMASAAVNLSSPTSEVSWRLARALIEELIEWDVRESRALGFDRAETMAAFYPESFEQIRRHSESRGGSFVLAMASDAAAGCAAIRRLSRDTCELFDVYVRPAYRGRGIASQLVAQMQIDARQSGFEVMRLETAIFMRDAHALYRSHGFEVCGHYREIPERYARATISMQCNLNITGVGMRPNTSFERTREG